jgi:hypothetical protein
MRTPESLRVAAALALAAAGCQSIVNPDKIAPITASSVCSSIYDKVLSRSEACFKSPKAWIQTSSPVPDCAGYDVSIDATRIQVDTSKLDTCLNDIGAANCYALFGAGGIVLPGTACPVLVLPQVPVGGVCYMNEECSTGTYCSDFAACPGTCRRFSGLGAPCGGSAQAFCDPSLVCRTSGAAGATGTSCLSPLAAGVECTTAKEGCASGLYCEFNAAAVPPTPQYTCQAQVGAASPCQGPEACLVPYLCTGATMPGTCKLPAAAGGACTVGANECGYGHFCQGAPAGTGSCVLYPSPPSAAGTCGSVNGELVDCIGGYCNGTACAPYIAVGKACSTTFLPDASVQCGRIQNGYYCAGTTALGTCASFVCREP